MNNGINKDISNDKGSNEFITQFIDDIFATLAEDMLNHKSALNDTYRINPELFYISLEVLIDKFSDDAISLDRIKNFVEKISDINKKNTLTTLLNDKITEIKSKSAKFKSTCEQSNNNENIEEGIDVSTNVEGASVSVMGDTFPCRII